MKKINIYLILIFIAFMACNKGNEGQGDPEQKLDFKSLTAEKDTISPGESTQIKAVATGYKLTYYWSATAGNILDTGATVNYAASPCQAGTNQITCEIKDGNNESKSKTISIVVL
ncbi:MAG: hypothetical protein JXB17_07470 [Bacteroidales bacterium]|nr:hypothetical protein [Bacteroidales bacterium]